MDTATTGISTLSLPAALPIFIFNPDAMTDLSVDPQVLASYRPTNKVRFVTAASLFDGHDAAINIMRRILQSSGPEVIHLGHNRSVAEIVDAAIQADAQAIALS